MRLSLVLVSLVLLALVAALCFGTLAGVETIGDAADEPRAAPAELFGPGGDLAEPRGAAAETASTATREPLAGVHRPESPLEISVLVRTRGGAPVAYARVALEDELGAALAPEVDADAEGLARFALELVPHGGLRARAWSPRVDPGLAGAVSLPAPLAAGTYEVEVEGTGSIVAEVRDGAGLGLAGIEVRLSGRDRDGETVERAETSGAGGAARFDRLRGGGYRLAATDPRTRKEIETRGINLVSGDVERIEVALSHPDERLAVGGRVLDDRGRPVAGLEVTFGLGRNAQKATTAADGAFAFWSLPAETVNVAIVRSTVRKDGSAGTVWEPNPAVVPFGTTGLVIRGAESGSIELVVRALDADDRTVVPGASLTLIVRDAADPQIETLAGQDPLRASVAAGATVDWTLRAPGYRTRLGTLAGWLELAEGAREDAGAATARLETALGGRVRTLTVDLPLVRGFSAEIQVHSADIRRRITGVHAQVDGRVVAFGDGAGRLVVELAEAPERLTIEADDHEPLDWFPRGASSAVLELRPRR